MKNIIRPKSCFLIFHIVLVAIILTSCAPQSKEKYFNRYKKFVTTVKTENEQYVEKDWEKAVKKYEKLNGEWFEKYKEDLTIDERIDITRYKLQYKSIKLIRDAEDIYDTHINDHYENVVNQLEFYIENDMPEDIDKVISEAEELGESAIEMVEKTLQEIGADSLLIQYQNQ